MHADVNVTFSNEPAGSALAGRLLSAYFAELAGRFPEGFDPELSIAAEPEELTPPHGTFLVLHVDGRPAGCGAVKTLTPGVGEVKRMWVDPAVRGRGLGAALLAALEEAARSLGHGSVRLDTSAHLPEAIALYRRHGYVEIPAYNDNRYAAHWFTKDLP